MEKVEIGGLRGRYLSPRVEEIYNEFSELYSSFGGAPYDCFDTGDNAFLIDYAKFSSKISDYDNKLACICGQAFEDCQDLESIFKVINIL